MGTAPASAREALDMVRAGLGYLAAADATQLSAATQAECLRELEQAAAVLTAARAFVQAGFTAGQGYADDAEYSAVSWLMHQKHITRGAAVGHAAWAKRAGTHPRVLAALAAGQVPESAGRLICLWTGRLPEKFRQESDELLVAAAAAGLGLEELAALAAQMYERARGDLPDADPDRDFADRGVKLATTFGGAGVIHGDLTPECAELVGRVLDALGAPAGADDDRTRDQRYHDALQEAMRWLRFCVMIGPPADPGARPAQGGRLWPSGPSLRRGGVGPCPAGRHRPGPASAACNPGATSRTPRCAGTGNGDPAAARQLRLPCLMPAAKLRRRGR